jgi:hypothetical protein
VGQRRDGEGLDVFGYDVIASVQQGMSAGELH